MGNVLSVKNLSKKYKNNTVVNGINMSIDRGDIYGFVGENGSGKTTVIRLITGLITPFSGEFELFGVRNTSDKIDEARAKIGAIVENPAIYTNMSAYDNLKNQCIILGIDDDEKIRSALSQVGLEELFQDKKQAGNFSLGMRQRLGIAMTLLGNPEFIILDEPMNGLDPAGIVSIRELILKLNREFGITFLISSHILNELSLVATKYGIISKGKIVEEITAEQLQSKCTKTTVITTDNPQMLVDVLYQNIANSFEFVVGGVKIIGEINLNELLSIIINNGINILTVNCCEISFEDYYLSVRGEVCK